MHSSVVKVESLRVLRTPKGATELKKKLMDRKKSEVRKGKLRKAKIF